MTRPDPDHSINALDGGRPVCAGSEDPDLWFDLDRVDLARSSCRSCPVRAACLAGAVQRSEEWGVWGGQLFEPSDRPTALVVAAAPVLDAPAARAAASSAVVVVPLRPSKPHTPSEAALRARPRVAAALALLRAEQAAGAAGGPEAA